MLPRGYQTKYGNEKARTILFLLILRVSCFRSIAFHLTDIRTYSIPFASLCITADEVATVLGYEPGVLPPPVDGMLNEALNEAARIVHVEAGLVLYESVIMDQASRQVIVGDTQLHVKAKIFHELEGSEMLAAFLCTAGEQISRLSKELMQGGKLLEGYLYDTIGSVVVEKALDQIQGSLREEQHSKGYEITNRYSPGYCGWETAGQFQLFRLFPNGFCKVTLTESALMIPVKSVSGIIGIGKNVVFKPYNCDLCELENCIYRKTKDIR